MAHIFFERLEKRQSTQTFFPSIGGNTAIAIYSAPLPDNFGWGNIGYNPLTPQLLYGISPPTTYPSGGYFPWGGGLFGMSGYSQYYPYSSWTNPFNSYNPWNSWGSGSFFNPFTNFFGGLFGGLFGGQFPWSWGNNNTIFPDFRVLYGVFPAPTQPIAYYGIGIPSTPPIGIATFYGIGVPSTGTFY